MKMKKFQDADDSFSKFKCQNYMKKGEGKGGGKQDLLTQK